MITINGKEYRNLQEQVLENMDDIESLKNREANTLLSTGITAGQVLTADGNGGTEWGPGSSEEAVQAPTALVSGNIVVGTTGGDRNVATLAAGALGDVLTQGAGAPTWAPLNVEGEDVKATGATAGQVLTADGNGGAEWAAAGGGGSGDVTASGTLSVGAVILGLGNKTITSSSGTSGKFLRWSGGATWSAIYMHTIHATRPQNPYTPAEVYFTVLSTASTAYTSLTGIPYGTYVASGNIDQTAFNQGQCRVLYFTRAASNSLGYWDSVNNTIATDGFSSGVTITDTVKSI